jgi:hypothetical protein
MHFADNIIAFITNLKFSVTLPRGTAVMNPFSQAETLKACKQFYKKYYSDKAPRRMIIGINPGRFGAGLTGIPFTDPIRLEQDCGIQNNWEKKQELSALYIYDMIKAYGGPDLFYKKFYISSVSPLGFTKAGKNLNYYEDPKLQERIKPFAIECLSRQLAFGVNRDIAYCLGEGKNFRMLSALNTEHGFFKQIIPLAHPRFIMQYRLKKKQEYIEHYLQQFQIPI